MTQIQNPNYFSADDQPSSLSTMMDDDAYLMSMVVDTDSLLPSNLTFSGLFEGESGLNAEEMTGRFFYVLFIQIFVVFLICFVGHGVDCILLACLLAPASTRRFVPSSQLAKKHSLSRTAMASLTWCHHSPNPFWGVDWQLSSRIVFARATRVYCFLYTPINNVFLRAKESWIQTTNRVVNQYD